MTNCSIHLEILENTAAGRSGWHSQVCIGTGTSAMGSGGGGGGGGSRNEETAQRRALRKAKVVLLQSEDQQTLQILIATPC